jgi:glycogen operon protein
VFRRRRFFRGSVRGGRDQIEDIAWFTPAGEEMTDADWDTGYAKSLAVFLNGDAISEPDRYGVPIQDSSFLLLFNASEQDLEFTVPPQRYGERWERVLDTAAPAEISGETVAAKSGEAVAVMNRSVQLLRRD